MKNITISQKEVKYLAKLASLPLSNDQIKKLPKELSMVIEYMSKIQRLNTSNIIETSQVTHLENIFREDEIEKDRMLTQEETLSNAPERYQGYFKVKAIFAE